jgi:hypothetical protein
MKTTTLILFLLHCFAATYVCKADERSSGQAVIEPSGAARTESADSDTNSPEKLSNGDRLLFAIQEDPQPAITAEEVSVTTQGEIHFRVTRGNEETITISAKDKTVEQVRTELKLKLDSDYYHNATVSLKMRDKNRRSSQIMFYGKGISGRTLLVPPDETKTVWEAIMQMGPNEFANLKKVKLHRKNPVTGVVEVRTINVQKIQETGNKADDIMVQDGDRIEVPERKFGF